MTRNSLGDTYGRTLGAFSKEVSPVGDSAKRLQNVLSPIQEQYGACFQDNSCQDFKNLYVIISEGAERLQLTGKHRPHHDVEALFWVFVFALVCALRQTKCKVYGAS